MWNTLRMARKPLTDQTLVRPTFKIHPDDGEALRVAAEDKGVSRGELLHRLLVRAQLVEARKWGNS